MKKESKITRIFKHIQNTSKLTYKDGGLNKITRDLIEENMINNSLDEIEQVEQVEQIKAEYFAIAKYKEQDTRGRNMYNAAFNKYIYFRTETKKRG